MIITLTANDLREAAAAHFKMLTKLDVSVDCISIEDNTAIIEYNEETVVAKAPVRRKQKQTKKAEVAKPKPEAQQDLFAEEPAPEAVAVEEAVEHAPVTKSATTSVFD